MAEPAPKAGEGQPTKIEPAPTKTEPAPTETEPAPKTEPTASSSKRPARISLASEQASKYLKRLEQDYDAWLEREYLKRL